MQKILELHKKTLKTILVCSLYIPKLCIFIHCYYVLTFTRMGKNKIKSLRAKAKFLYFCKVVSCHTQMHV